MTKILVYHVRDDEQPLIDEWSKEHAIQVDSVPDELHADTVSWAKGYDGVVYKQRSVLSKDVQFYEQLRALGIKQLACRSAGIDSVNLEWAQQNGITVTNVPSYSPTAVAELVLAQTLQLVRQLPQFESRINENNYCVNGLRARELSELTIGIIGVGRIGGTVAKIFHALGATVLGNDIAQPRAELKGILRYTTKEELLRQADIVTVHVYYNSQNQHLISEEQFALMKNSAYFINDSRGPVVDTEDLLRALKNEQIAACALDVVEGETQIFNLKFAQETPVANYNELKKLPNVLLTPHIGFFTDIAVENMVKQALDDALTIIMGHTSAHEINFKKVAASKNGRNT
ncbi:D-2-hydroxyacid dehydrogenase [Liquorilactobacillus satsumensis]|uniref:D-2-hydroxyacid dehydrogenase n=1 Tax=Liquorilactobacillus satsumensis TaxID=259059 RepID=UPI0021C3C79D|nr:D-2-hydroxyacid dehydrogenase [Liquorilactobacillus satsumensis]MCP9328522.1 D-2-hydroxyacid dehydrogenase [Liquorilactobacillus satsumensis]